MRNDDNCAMEFPVEILPTKNGGARPGAGRKGKAFEDAADAAAIESGVPAFNTSKAHKEYWAAKNTELEFKKNHGLYVSRAEVQRVCASAMSALVQAMRSMPDNLERKFGLTPDVTQEIGKVVDECLDDIGKEFELFGAGGGPDV